MAHQGEREGMGALGMMGMSYAFLIADCEGSEQAHN